LCRYLLSSTLKSKLFSSNLP